MSSITEEVEAIKKLKARYAEGSDTLCTAHDAEPFLNCLTKDAVWDGASLGRYEGYEAIKKFTEEIKKQFTFSVHFFTNPNIEVDGDKAWGRWYLLGMFTQADEQAIWLVGAEDDKYRKVNNQWLISEMKLTPFFIGPYAEGWQKKKGYG